MFVGFGCKEMRHSFAPVGSSHPAMMGSCRGLYTTACCFVITTLQSASNMLPIPNKVCLKKGIACPVQGKSDGRLGSANMPMPTDHFTWPVAVPK